MSPGWRGLVIALFALAGGALNLYRHVWWHSSGTPRTFGFCAPPELLLSRDLNRFVPGYCRIEIPDARWRPLDVSIEMRAPDPLPATAAAIGSAGHTVHITADDPTMQTDVETVTVGEAWRPYTFTITRPPKPQAPTVLVLRLEQPNIADPLLAYVVAGPLVGRVDVKPRFSVGAVAWPMAAGAIFGVALALLLPGIGPRLTSRPKPITHSPKPRARSLARFLAHFLARSLACSWIFFALFAYFAVWALLRPPYQTPDEPQHHLRASSILREPLFTRPGVWTIDPRFANPLAQWTPLTLFKLFFRPTQHLTDAEVHQLKDITWLPPSTRPPPEPCEKAIASYPTLYYLTLFAIAEPVTRLLHLSPYDSTYAWRLVSAALAALCWMLVVVLLARLPATRESAGAIGALLVLNPMTAFMSSAINVDAVNIPLAVLASLLCWRLLEHGVGQSWTLAALLATAWTKPSGLQLIGALLFACVVLRICRMVSSSQFTGLLWTLARAAVVSWGAFYAWSPPRFLGGAPSDDTLMTFLVWRWLHAPDIWVTYWGLLGWLEYSLAPIWYALVFAAVLIGIACALWRPRGSRPFMLFATALLGAFVGATLLGEFVYLPVSGYVLQGRHLLPASLGLVVLVMHRVAPARLALLGLLVLMNVLLIQATVDRYYSGQWRLAAYAMPFTR
jgi:hypothetical protein